VGERPLHDVPHHRSHHQCRRLGTASCTPCCCSPLLSKARERLRRLLWLWPFPGAAVVSVAAFAWTAYHRGCRAGTGWESSKLVAILVIIIKSGLARPTCLPWGRVLRHGVRVMRPPDGLLFFYFPAHFPGAGFPPHNPPSYYSSSGGVVVCPASFAMASGFHYVTTAHKASGVSSAVVGHFTAPDELNLIVRCASLPHTTFCPHALT